MTQEMWVITSLSKVDFPQFIPHNPIFVTGNEQVPQRFCWFKLDSLFIDHLWGPLTAHTVKREAANAHHCDDIL